MLKPLVLAMFKYELEFVNFVHNLKDCSLLKGMTLPELV